MVALRRWRWKVEKERDVKRNTKSRKGKERALKKLYKR
jgi:hypothetical protein